MGNDQRRGPLVAIAVATILLVPFAACGNPLAPDEVAGDGGSDASQPDGASADVDASVGPSDGGATCPTGGITSAGHCYFRGPTDVDQATASAACADAGAHLATLTSATEEALVLPLVAIDGKCWIGLVSDTGSTDAAAYRWITNEDASYQHWGAQEPDGEKCVVQEDYGWNSKACSEPYGTLCERP